MTTENKAVHVLAGGVAGTVSSVATCPLDVAKTRLQSSWVKDARPSLGVSATGGEGMAVRLSRPQNTLGFYHCLRHIVKTEGVSALFKGLGPTLIGVAPSRAVYFGTYAHCKNTYGDVICPSTKMGLSVVHLLSAASAAFVTTTVSNPIWLVRTRLQLDQKRDTTLTTFQCARRVYEREGVRGFYRGLTASYYGIAETVIHFVLYEYLRAKLIEQRSRRQAVGDVPNHRLFDFVEYMGAGAVAKGVATCIGYPHEVARTRMREEGNSQRYRRFWQTLSLVAREEGVRGVYGGLSTQLIKHIPNMAIMMSTYEAVVYVARRQGL